MKKIEYWFEINLGFGSYNHFKFIISIFVFMILLIIYGLHTK